MNKIEKIVDHLQSQDPNKTQYTIGELDAAAIATGHKSMGPTVSKLSRIDRGLYDITGVIVPISKNYDPTSDRQRTWKGKLPRRKVKYQLRWTIIQEMN